MTVSHLEILSLQRELLSFLWVFFFFLNVYFILSTSLYKNIHWNFPGGPVAKTSGSKCKGSKFDPWSGNYIPHAAAKSLQASTKGSCMPQ